MNDPGTKWTDLNARMGAGAAMVVIGLLGIWMGGHVFHALVAIVCGIMVWELVGMLRPNPSMAHLHLGTLTGAAVFVAIYLPAGFALPLLLAPALIGFGQLERNRTIYICFSVMILVAGYGMMQVRDDMGFVWLSWL
ncbi:MAG: phosphatidate cytidylyltransferase, partial [Pseudomonadota bacterium]